MEEFVHSAHAIGNNVHHIEWCTKYRYEMFGKAEHRNDLKEIICVVAQRHGIEIIESGIMPDHVHLVVRLKPAMSQSEAVRLLKGASAYEMFRKHPNYRKRYPRGHLWSCGNFKDSVGRVQQSVIERYVRDDNNLAGNPAL
ncbi:MAG: IS200/IS605 family transposase [Candidatus Aenigmarchaeota archaeon]|nr:IS200/IS605 family transposase [Candidatus Aenigmarchaeota archaeon]